MTCGAAEHRRSRTARGGEFHETRAQNLSQSPADFSCLWI